MAGTEPQVNDTQLGSDIPLVPADALNYRILYEVQAKKYQITDLSQLLEEVMDVAIAATRAERGFVVLFGEGGEGLDFRVARNLRRNVIKNPDVSRTILRAAEQGEGSFVPQLYREREYGIAESLLLTGVRSLLCVPLRRYVAGQGLDETDHAVLGAVYVDKIFEATPFEPQDYWMLFAIANEAAMAIQTAELIEQLREKNRRIEQLYEAAQHHAERLRAENVSLKRQVGEHHTFGDMIGQSKVMLRLFERIERIRQSSANVIITGESGTGKELVARTIHSGGPRAAQPFVVVNCAAIPESLLESELFGHERGAFTGAHTRKLGKFEVADGGTLFLDEVGELPLAMQAKLLRVLQFGVFERVGGTEPIRVDVRILAATNRDLYREMAEGRFREDLFYRLNILNIHLPPLRERREDIALLLPHFVDKWCTRFRRSIRGFSPEAMQRLMDHDYPGNVRELENLLQRAILLTEDGGMVQAEAIEIAPLTPAVASAPERDSDVRLVPIDKTVPLRQSLDEIERLLIDEALEASGGNVSMAARRLGMDRGTLYYRLKKHGILGD